MDETLTTPHGEGMLPYDPTDIQPGWQHRPPFSATAEEYKRWHAATEEKWQKILREHPVSQAFIHAHFNPNDYAMADIEDSIANNTSTWQI